MPKGSSGWKTLGAFFLLLALGCAIGGYLNSKETRLEEIQHDYVRTTQSSYYDAIRQFTQAGASNPEQLADAAVGTALKDGQSELEKMRGQREQRMIYFFVPAGLLAIIGLLCIARSGNT